VILWRGALTNFTTSQTRFFIFVFGLRHMFKRRRGLFRFRFRFRFGRRRRRRRLLLGHRFSFVFFRLGVQFRSFGDDYLRLLTGLGEDGELGGGVLFATTGLITIRVWVGLGHLT